MKRGSIGLFIVILSLMTALRGGSELDSQAFVFSIALDSDPSGKLIVSMQIPNAKPEGESGGSGTDGDGKAGGNGSGDGNEIIIASGMTYLDASEVLDASIPREINFSQVLQVVASEEVASRSDFITVLEDVLRTKNMRQSAALVICRGKAEDFIKEQKAFLGIRLSINIETNMDIAKTLGVIPSAQIGEVVRMSRGAWRDAIVPYAAISANWDKEELLQIDNEGHPLDFQAGDLPESTNSRVEYVGAALLRDSKMIGSLTGMEMQFLSCMMGNMHQITYYVDDVYYRVRLIKPMSISAKKNGDGWILRAEGHILASVVREGEAHEERLRDAFIHEMFNLLKKLQSLGVDPIGFQGKAVRTVPTISDWSQADWIQDYQNATTEVVISVTIGEME